jgi:hypothetical protein
MFTMAVTKLCRLMKIPRSKGDRTGPRRTSAILRFSTSSNGSTSNAVHFPAPPPFSAYEPDSFALFTVQKRLPKILADVKRELREQHRSDPRWNALEMAIVGGGPVDVGLLATDTPYWTARVAALAGSTWADQPFFDLEFLFYKAIDTIVRDLEPGLDVFANTRRAALLGALPEVGKAVESVNPLSLDAALLLALFGNEADLSQLTASRAPSERGVLVDERPDIVDRLRSLPAGSVVQIVADNAGSELCFDLVVVAVLLELGVDVVELQVKPSPMFVSDALAQDVEETVASFEKVPATSALSRVGQALRRAIGDDRVRIRAPRDWSEPRHVDALEPDLSRALSTAHLVLVKGDLNYRRYFGDRAWPAETTVDVASLSIDQHAFALRVLKSDCVVGIPAAEVTRLSSTDRTWRTNLEHSIIQRISARPARAPKP